MQNMPLLFYYIINIIDFTIKGILQKKPGNNRIALYHNANILGLSVAHKEANCANIIGAGGAKRIPRSPSTQLFV